MTNINELVRVSVNKQKYKVPLALEDVLNPKYIVERSELLQLLQEEEKIKLNKRTKPELKEGQFAVPFREKLKERRFNPRTNRMKKFKVTKWYITDIKPEDRTLKNLPRYSDKKAKVRFQDWLMLDRPSDISANKNVHSVGRSPNGTWYGWSHRAVGSFKIGQLIKPGNIGNKYEYDEKVSKEHHTLSKKHGYEVADKTIKDKYGKFEPYTIKTDSEAREHAIRYANDVA